MTGGAGSNDPDADAGSEIPITREWRRLRDAQQQLSERLHRLHAETDRLHLIAERLHRSVHRCEDSLHAAEELIARRPRRSDQSPETSSISRIAP